MSFKNDGVIYFNLSLTNSTLAPIPAILEQNNQNAIIENASAYNLQVVKFSVPTSLIPSLTVPIVSNQPNPNLTSYTVSMSIDGVNFYTEPVIFVPDVININNDNNLYYNYYDIIELVDIVNTALLSAYNDVLLANPTFPDNTNAPFINYNYNTRLFELWSSVQTIDRPDPLQIFMNDILLQNFNLPATVNPLSATLHNQIIIKNRKLNLGRLPNELLANWIITTSDNITRFKASFQKLILVSNYGFPVTSEYVQAPVAGIPIGNQLQSNNSQTILTDFDPDYSQDNTAYLQFQSSGIANARPINFINNQPIQSFQIQFNFQDNKNNISTVLIPSGQSVSIKIAFVPRQYLQNSRSSFEKT